MRLHRGSDRVPASELLSRSGATFPELVDRLRLGERDAFEELFDVFFRYVHHHVERSARRDGLSIKLCEQVTETALLALFEELMQGEERMQGAGDARPEIAPSRNGGSATGLPPELERRDGSMPRRPTPTWTRRALDLAAAAQRSLDRRRMPRAR